MIKLNNKKELKKYLDIIINSLETSNNLLFDERKNIGKLAIEIKKNIKKNCSNELASKFDRLYQKTILNKTITDTDEMVNYYDLKIQLNEFKNLL